MFFIIFIFSYLLIVSDHQKQNEPKLTSLIVGYLSLLYLQEEQNTVPLSTLLEVVNTVRSFGNRCFNQSRYDNAKDRYKQVNL